MSEPGKTGSGGITDRAAELANKAAAAAGPLAAQARERATELAHQAAPHVSQARQQASKGVTGLAGRLSKLNGGKYADKINAVSSKIADKLEEKPEGATEGFAAEPPPAAYPPPAAAYPPPAEPPTAAYPPPADLPITDPPSPEPPASGPTGTSGTV
jgi:hypothetical protein